MNGSKFSERIGTRGFAWLLVFALVCAIVIDAGAQVEAENYRLSANDVVSIKVHQEDDLSTTARINGDGSITAPLVGTVKIGKLTVDEAIRKIEAAYKDGRFLVLPRVTLIVEEYSKLRFTILGQVQRPGAVNLPDGERVTLLQAIGLAGGYTRIADPGKILIKREGKLIKVNAKKVVDGVDAGAFVVNPGDVITVGESMF